LSMGGTDSWCDAPVEASSIAGLPEILLARAHGLLASDLVVQHAVEAAMRCVILLARRPEISVHWLLSRAWVAPLAVLVSSSVCSLKRVALALAMLLLPSLWPSMLQVSPVAKIQSSARSFGASDFLTSKADPKYTTWPSTNRRACMAFLRALHNCLAGPSAAKSSLRHSFQLKGALWLVGELAPVGCNESVQADVAPGQEVAAWSCAMNWVDHSDAIVRALAWRGLYTLAFRRQRGDLAAGAAAFAPALRVLRGEFRSEQPCKTMMPCDEELLLVHAEVLEFLRLSLETARRQTDNNGRESLSDAQSHVAQILEAGILLAEPLRFCLESSHCGPRRAAVRLLHTMLLVDSTGSVPDALLRAGLWPRVADCFCFAESRRPTPSPSSLDAVTLAADVASFIGTSVTSDPQMLGWFGTSTNLFCNWRAAIRALLGRGLMSTSSKEEPHVGASGGCRLHEAVLVHLGMFCALAAALRNEMCAGTASTEGRHTGSTDSGALELLTSDEAAELVAEAFCETMPAAVRGSAAASAAGLAGLPMKPGCISGLAASEKIGRRSSMFWLWAISQPGAAAPGICEGSTVGHQRARQVAAVAHRCLVNLFSVSSVSGAAACKAGFLPALVRHIAMLTSQPALVEHQARLPAPVSQRLVWALRLLTAFVTSAEAVLEDAIGSSDYGGNSKTPKALPPLLEALLCCRSSAEKDDAVCLELLELLRRCGFCERTRQVRHEPKQPDSAELSQGEDLPSLLLRSEFVQWMARFSQRRKLSPVVYCKLMEALSLCSPALAGKPLLFRYLTHLVEAVEVSCRRQGGSVPSFLDEWSCRRLVSTLHFVASSRLCARCVAILLSPAPAAHGPSNAVAGAAAAGGRSGMDLWLDLIEPGRAGIPASLRAASLRVLLATLIGPARDQAKAHFLSSSRALTLLLGIIQNSANGVGHQLAALLSLNIIWALAHHCQRAVAALKQLRASEVAHAAAASWPCHGSDEEVARHATLMARQLGTMLV